MTAQQDSTASASRSIPKFEDALDVTPLDDGRNWRVTAPFYYDTDVRLSPSPGQYTLGYRPELPIRALPDPPHQGQWRINIPAGFETDFASVPQLLWNLLPPTGRYTRAAVVHDFLYRTPGLCTRAQADAVLYEAMKFPCHVGFFTRWTIYLGVRVGGHFAYKGQL